MGLMLSGQIRESKKVRVNRRPILVAPATKARTCGPRQEGTWWKQRMQSLALRLSKRRARRHASGAPMKRGSMKHG